MIEETRPISGARVSTREETIALLREAEAAYHELVLGLAPKVIVHQNGQRVEYNSANRNVLKSYIAELKVSLGTLPSGPMRVFF